MPKRSKKRVRQFLSIYEQNSRETRRQDGRLHVRCVHALGLQAGDHHFFRKGTSDPFCIIAYSDGDGSYSRCRTRTIGRTRAPVWNQQFTFGVREGARRVTLEFDVWDNDFGEGDNDFLGTASLELKLTDLSDAHDWKRHPLTLKEDELKGKIKLKSPTEKLGIIEVRVYWEPWSQSTWLMVWRTVARSSKAVTTLASFILLLTEAIAVVAGAGRWLCQGERWHSCTRVEVTGVLDAAHRSANFIFVAAFIQFCGAMGAWGSDWSASPPHMYDMLEDPEDEDMEDIRKKESEQQQLKEPYLTMDEPSLDLHIVVSKAGPSFFDYKLFLGLLTIQHCTLKTLRLTLRHIAYMAHLLPILLLTTCLLWSFIQKGEGMILGEGAYLAVAAVLLLVITQIMFRLTSYLQVEERPVWTRNTSILDEIHAERLARRQDLGELRWRFTQIGHKARERFLEPLKQKVLGDPSRPVDLADEEMGWSQRSFVSSSVGGSSGMMTPLAGFGGMEDDDEDDDDEEKERRRNTTSIFYCGGCGPSKQRTKTRGKD